MISSRTIERDSLVFVYGTLRPVTDTPLARWLAAHARYVGPARTRGRLYDLGAYPGLLPALSSAEWVSGDLYGLPRRAALLRVLDRYEIERGRGLARFERVRRCVELRGRHVPARTRVLDAWLYVYMRSIVRGARIVSGDYSRVIGPRDHRE